MKKKPGFFYSPMVFVFLFIVVILMVLLLPFLGYSQYSLNTTTYSQDFNGLGTGNSTVSGGNMNLINASLNGWYFYETGTNANTTITAGTGSSNSGDTYNFGLTGNSDRALGGLQSGTLIPLYGFYFKNNTGSTITSLTFNYTGEVWRVGSINRTDEIDFQYSTNAASLTTGTWSSTIASLSYIDAAQTSTASGSIIQSANISNSLTGLNITAGATFFIKWVDKTASGADDGMAIDNFSFTCNTGPTSAITVSAVHPASGSINTGTVYNPLYSVQCVVANAAATLTSVTLNTSGTYTNSDIPTSGFRLSFNSIANTLLGANVIYLGSAYANSGGTITFSSLSQNLSVGTGYLIVSADINNSTIAVANHTVQLITPAFNSITFAGTVSLSGSPIGNGNAQTIALSPSFTAGHLAVLRVGDGSTPISNAGTPAQVLQFDTYTANQSGTVITSLPQVAATNTTGQIIPKAITQSGSSISEGDISLSVNGSYLIVAGYNSYAGETGVANSTTDDAVIGKIDATGSANTITSFSRATCFNGSNFRSACTNDGTGYWSSGTSSGSTGGVWYITDGSSSSTTAAQVSTTITNTRTINIYNSQLYASTMSGSNRLLNVGNGLPTTSGNTETNLLTASGDPYSFVIVNINGNYVMYIASLSSQTIDKYSLVSGTWMSNGSFSTTSPSSNFPRGITGNINCSGTINLYTTVSTTATSRPTILNKYIDNAGYSQTINISATVTTLATAGTNYAFGGVAFTPYQDLTISGSQTIAAGNAYRNITITPTGSATLGGDVSALGNVTVNSGAILDCQTNHILTNSDFTSSFSLLNSSTLKTGESNGIQATAYTGAIQTCARSFDVAANYEYEGNGPQNTGDGLPLTVNNLTLSNTSSTSLTHSVSVSNTLNLGTGTSLNINGNTLSLNGTISGVGTLTGSTTSNLSIGGSYNTSVGTLNFTPGWQVLNSVSINRYNGTVSNAATLGSNLTANNIILTNGILSTGANLFTWNNAGGTLTMPGPTANGGNGSGNYYDSYIATCDASGTPVTGGANATTPYIGSVGMRINNVAATPIYFPVGVSYLPAQSASGAGYNQPSPNRVMVKNYGNAQWYAVAIDYGDIGSTPSARVNRIWYITTGDTTAANHNSDLQLFYTKRDWTNWSSGENEIESGFDYDQGSLVQKDYNSADNNFVNISTLATADVPHWTGNAYGTEIYGQYTNASGMSTTNRIIQFNRFSIVNPNGIILPVTIINFKAYQQKQDVVTEWTSLSEINIKEYEIQRSLNGLDFITIGVQNALNNGAPSINYSFLDTHPFSGNNFYRIKVTGSDGRVIFTNIQLVNIGHTSSNISIYPNPVTNRQFNLQMSNVPVGNYYLSIHNSIGQIIFSKQINVSIGSSSQIINLPSSVARGAYYFQITGNEMMTEKIIIQ